MSNIRELKQMVMGRQIADGAGVQLKRIIASPELDMLDPFLLFDAFGSDEPQDYIAGFPPHPHRGFETVTYMLAGKMRHEDSAGNAGVIETGGVQWMTAGKGIIHSEMPEQQDGLLAGFQLWVNLPASQKMTQPKYQEYSVDNVPLEHHDNGIKIRVIAGKTDKGTFGVIENNEVNPFYFHVDIPEGERFEQHLPDSHNSFIYVIDGAVTLGGQQKRLASGQLGVLSREMGLTSTQKK